MEGASDTPMDDDGESRPETAGLGAYRWLTASASRRWGFLVLFTLVTRLPILTYPKACA